MFKLVRKLRNNQEGTTAIEYGLIAALVSVAAILAMQALGTSLSGMFGSISTTVSSSTPAASSDDSTTSDDPS